MKKVIITIVMLVAVVALLIVLRPTKAVSKISFVEEKEDGILSQMVDEAEAEAEKEASRKAKTEPAEVKAPSKPQIKEVEKEKPVENAGNSSLQDSYAEHGENSFIKPKMKVNKGKTPEKISTVEADFSKPLGITFYGLKKIFMYHHINGRYPKKIAEGFNGMAAKIIGTIMPVETVPESGEMTRFWLANPKVVMAGCIFCNPPTLADIIYVYMPANGNKLFKVDREKLYKQITMVTVTGRFFIVPGAVTGTEYLFSLELDDYEILN